jgi:hypothetical protein
MVLNGASFASNVENPAPNLFWKLLLNTEIK